MREVERSNKLVLSSVVGGCILVWTPLRYGVCTESMYILILVLQATLSQAACERVWLARLATIGGSAGEL